MTSANSNRTEELLSEILKWTKFTASDKVRSVLGATLDTPQKKLIYHLSDGSRGSVDIATTAETSDRTVRRYWESWVRVGIMGKVQVRGGDRAKKAFELEDFGFDIPEVRETQSNPAQPSEGEPQP